MNTSISARQKQRKASEPRELLEEAQKTKDAFTLCEYTEVDIKVSFPFAEKHGSVRRVENWFELW